MVDISGGRSHRSALMGASVGEARVARLKSSDDGERLTTRMKREAVFALAWLVAVTLASVCVAVDVPRGEVGTWQMQTWPGDMWQHDVYDMYEDGTFSGSGYGDTYSGPWLISYNYTYYGDTVSSDCNEYSDGVVIHAIGFWLSETTTYADGTTGGNSYDHKDVYCVYRHLDPATGLITAYRYKMSTEQPMSFVHGECPAQAIDAFNNGISWMTTGVTHLSDVVWKCIDNCKPFTCSKKSKSPAVIIGAAVGGLAAILIATVLVMLYRHGKLRCLTRQGVSQGVTIVAEKSKKQVRHAKARMMLGSTTMQAHNRRRAAKRQMTNTGLDPASQSEEGRSAANMSRTIVRPNVVPVRREQPVISGLTSPAPTVIVVQQQQPAQQTVSATTNGHAPETTDEGAN